MSKEYEFMCDGHNSIYVENYLENNYCNRKFKVLFNEPDMGINCETGILLLINGFGANVNSNVYKKMRDEFSDRYNLVTVQCEYFGSEFMDASMDKINRIRVTGDEEGFKEKYLQNLDINNFLVDGKLKEKTKLELDVVLDETFDNFNDMGIMQAIDNITATLNVISIIYNNNYKFNTKKIMIYGQSHGAYLAYLCNGLCQNLYTHILDNSAWVYPKYILGMRYFEFKKINEAKLIYKYLISDIFKNDKIFSIDRVYKNFKNKCKITVYHGAGDSLVSLQEKKDGIDSIENIVVNEVDCKMIDGKLFTSIEHGLGADFLKLFDKYYNSIQFDKGDKLVFDNIINLYDYFIIDYTKGIPEIKILREDN